MKTASGMQLFVAPDVDVHASESSYFKVCSVEMLIFTDSTAWWVMQTFIQEEEVERQFSM